MSLKKDCLLMLLMVIALSLGGCGYHFAGGGASLSPMTGKSVTIPIFSNTTHRPNMETIVTGQVRDEFGRRTGGRLADQEGADLVLQGTVSTYSSAAVSYAADDRIREYRATMTVEATLRERTTGKVLWKGTRTVFQDYPVIELPLNNPSITERLQPQNRSVLQQNAEDVAIREIAVKLARDLYEQINERF